LLTLASPSAPGKAAAAYAFVLNLPGVVTPGLVALLCDASVRKASWSSFAVMHQLFDCPQHLSFVGGFDLSTKHLQLQQFAGQDISSLSQLVFSLFHTPLPAWPLEPPLDAHWASSSALDPAIALHAGREAWAALRCALELTRRVDDAERRRKAAQLERLNPSRFGRGPGGRPPR